jgi:hypothetical protein
MHKQDDNKYEDESKSKFYSQNDSQPDDFIFRETIKGNEIINQSEVENFKT